MFWKRDEKKPVINDKDTNSIAVPARNSNSDKQKQREDIEKMRKRGFDSGFVYYED